MAAPKPEISDAEKIRRLRSALSVSLGALQGVRDAAGGFGASSVLNDTIRKAKKALRDTGSDDPGVEHDREHTNHPRS